VLDEADRMLDLGFLDDVERILAMLPDDRQTMLFSATMPDPIVTLARRFLRHPVTIHAGHSAETGPSPLTQQVVYRTHPMNKIEVVARILQARGRGLTMIFTRTKRAADRVAEDLDFRGFAAAAVHGDLGQGARERALRAFRSGKIDVLVATDVAARGLDVSGVTHVINYDCPEDQDTYTHRIGRTGRAGATGVAVTFVDWEDLPRWRLIDKSLGLDMADPPETYHTSPYLFTDLDIPTDITGTLPTAARVRAGLHAEVEEDLGGRPPGGRRGEGPGRGRRGGEAPAGRRRRAGGSAADTPPAQPVDPATPDDGAPGRTRRRRRRRAGQELAGDPGTGQPAGAAAEPGSGDPSRSATGGPASAGRRGAAGRQGAAGTEGADPAFGDGAEPVPGAATRPARRRRRRGGRGSRDESAAPVEG
ncbi:MAG TPA: DEAD/DEAH box helicase, partial [Pilimelia sp.]|nr:DEAD/DEAH box helicase [Pilimelia sp.]